MPQGRQHYSRCSAAFALVVPLLAVAAAALPPAGVAGVPLQGEAPGNAGSSGGRSLLLLGLLDLSGCTLSLGAWYGPSSGLFTLPATMVCPPLASLVGVLGTWCASATGSGGSYSQTKSCTTVLLTTGQTFQFTQAPPLRKSTALMYEAASPAPVNATVKEMSLDPALVPPAVAASPSPATAGDQVDPRSIQVDPIVTESVLPASRINWLAIGLSLLAIPAAAAGIFLALRVRRRRRAASARVVDGCASPRAGAGGSHVLQPLRMVRVIQEPPPAAALWGSEAAQAEPLTPRVDALSAAHKRRSGEMLHLDALGPPAPQPLHHPPAARGRGYTFFAALAHLRRSNLGKGSAAVAPLPAEAAHTSYPV
ncbi:hypothetical protein ABPG75_005669 [Micractinium tetrahymenae]